MKINIKTSIYILYNRIISLFFNLELKQNLTRILDIMQDLFLSVNREMDQKLYRLQKVKKEAQSIRKDHEDWIIQIYCVDLFIIFELINPDIKYIFYRYLLHYITILFLLPGTVVVYNRNE